MTSLFAKIIEIPMGVILQPILFLGEGFLGLANALLTWVVNISLSGDWALTSPAKNELINVGWTLTRDLANIGIVLGLVFIGLGTALRLTEFKTQKAFVWLLIIALFINFTPLICGLIVDASNILMKFFLPTGVSSEIGKTFLEKVFRAHMGGLLEMFAGKVAFASIFKFLVLIAIGFIGGFALILFAALFLLRMVAIPILVILSPIAFFCYIFDQTKKYFEMWWNQLLQWSLIGAVGGFFLYLTHHCLRVIEKTPLIWQRAVPTGAIGSEAAVFLGTVSSYFVVLAFLVIGLLATFQFSPMGAKELTAWAKTKGKSALWAGSKGIGNILRGATTGMYKGTVKGVSEGKGGWGKTLGGLKGFGMGALRGGWTTEGQEEGKTSTVEMATKGREMLEKMHLIPIGSTESYQQKAVAAEAAKSKALSTDTLIKGAETYANTIKGKGMLSNLIQRGELPSSLISQTTKAINQEWLPKKPFLEKYPHAADQLQTTIADVTKNWSANQFAKTTKENWNNAPYVLEAVKRMGKNLGALVRRLDTDKRGNALNVYNQLNQNPEQLNSFLDTNFQQDRKQRAEFIGNFQKLAANIKLDLAYQEPPPTPTVIVETGEKEK